MKGGHVGIEIERKYIIVRPCLSDMEKCAPYTDNAARELDGQSCAHVYRAVSSMDAEHVYYAIYVNDKNERCLVYFEVIKKSLKMIKTYHPATVMTNLPF